MWKFYTSNTEILDEIIKTCEEAKKSIDLEQFIFVADNFGNKLIEVCARKAMEGIKVRFLWDSAGSFNFWKLTAIEDLRKKGIELVFFNTFFPHFLKAHKYKSWYFRNHKRTVVIDGEIGFTGSFCIDERMKNWKEMSIKIDGQVVKDMQESFEKTWSRANGEKIKKTNKIMQDNEFIYITNEPFPGKHKLYKKVTESIKNSQKYIYITTPYFIPTHKITKIIEKVTKKGVDVRIIIPEKSDHHIIDLGARTYFHKLLKSGARIFLYKDQMIHNKTIVIDDIWSSIGTLNFDNVGLLYNFEANIISNNIQFTKELKDYFINDMNKCHEITISEWEDNFTYEKFLGFFIRLIRKFL